MTLPQITFEQAEVIAKRLNVQAVVAPDKWVAVQADDIVKLLEFMGDLVAACEFSRERVKILYKKHYLGELEDVDHSLYCNEVIALLNKSLGGV